jgi:hypothetical protein
MRSELHVGVGLAACTFLLLGAVVALKLTRPSTAEPGTPVNWEVATPPPAPAARLPVVRASAARRSLPPTVLRTLKKDRPWPEVAPLGAAVPGEARALPAEAVTAADAFQVRLEPSAQTPRGYAYADALRAALTRQGAVAARRSGKVIWSIDREFVARLNDGSRVAIIGGYGVTELSFRELTPDTCRLLIGAAEGARAYLVFPGAVLHPPNVGAAGGWANHATVKDARALCARLGPAFDAWRRAARTAPPDLVDLDRREVSISRPGGGSAPGQTGSAPGQPGSVRQALFY